MNFSELKLSKNTMVALERKGFAEATEIQEKVIPVALSGSDVVGKAKTGTGKTAAFGIPIVEMTVPGNAFSSLIIVPTRELARQVKEEIKSISIGSRVKTTAVFGGQRINQQLDLLDKRPEIIVGTPGRILDLVQRRALHLDKAKCLVLDEADRMFDMGFRVDVERIISLLPKKKQTMLFSATMPEEIMSLMDRHLRHDRVFFDLSTDNAPVAEIKQFFVMAGKDRKVSALLKILESDNSKTLIFCRTKRTVDWLERQLSRRNIRALSIHGDKTQSQRNKIIDIFKQYQNAILIATDIVARGIHVDDIENVINFDCPTEPETYIHRIGRTARQGKKGKAISICSSNQEISNLGRIAERNNSTLYELQ